MTKRWEFILLIISSFCLPIQGSTKKIKKQSPGGVLQKSVLNKFGKFTGKQPHLKVNILVAVNQQQPSRCALNNSFPRNADKNCENIPGRVRFYSSFRPCKGGYF